MTIMSLARYRSPARATTAILVIQQNINFALARLPVQLSQPAITPSGHNNTATPRHRTINKKNEKHVNTLSNAELVWPSVRTPPRELWLQICSPNGPKRSMDDAGTPRAGCPWDTKGLGEPHWPLKPIVMYGRKVLTAHVAWVCTRLMKPLIVSILEYN